MSVKDRRERTQPPLGKWPAGMDNVHDLKELQARGALRKALNADISNNGRARRRRGYTSIFGGNCHSLWAPEDWPYALFVKDDVLQRLEIVDGAEKLTALSGVAKGKYFSWGAAGDWAFGSNGIQRIKVDIFGLASAWGVDEPGGQPQLTAAADGGLAPGGYQVAITYLTSTGEESGTPNSVSVQLAAGQAVQITNIPQPAAGSGVTTIRVYATPPNGEALYAVKDLPVGTTSTLLRETDRPGRLLETSLHTRIPAGSIVRTFRARAYVVVGKVLYYSPAMRYGVCKQHQASFRFAHAIQDVAPVDDGLYVGTERLTYYLGGDDPTKITQRVVDAFGIVPRSYARVRGNVFGPDTSQTPVAVWWNTNGNLVRGESQGSVTHLTAGRLALPRYASGATVLREVNGISQILSALRGPGETSAFAARDTAVAEVVRNGITVT